MDMNTTNKLFQKYIYGWKTSNKQLILSVCDPKCQITECYGPKYDGIKQIEKWIDDWVDKNHQVEQWDILDSYFDSQSLTAVYEWTFACYSEKRDHHFKGCSVVRFNKEYIENIREYRMEPVHYYPYR